MERSIYLRPPATAKIIGKKLFLSSFYPHYLVFSLNVKVDIFFNAMNFSLFFFFFIRVKYAIISTKIDNTFSTYTYHFDIAVWTSATG